MSGRSLRGLILPGYGDSGPEHWQSRWEARHPGLVRVEQSDWLTPRLGDWQRRLENAVAQAGPDTVLIAHSLGCLLAVHWALLSSRSVRGALLVAPPDPWSPLYPRTSYGFAPVPWRRLPFPSALVASTVDPYATLEFSSRCAAAWGSKLIDIGPAGHINGDSGLSDWDWGWELVQELGRQ